MPIRSSKNFYHRCASLSDFPKSHPWIADPKSRGMRRLVHGNYLVFFRIADHTVEVMHVLHGARDYQRLLFPGDER
jgi:plasmid stabilization system protein ParE